MSIIKNIKKTIINTSFLIVTVLSLVACADRNFKIDLGKYISYSDGVEGEMWVIEEKNTGHTEIAGDKSLGLPFSYEVIKKSKRTLPEDFSFESYRLETKTDLAFYDFKFHIGSVDGVIEMSISKYDDNTYIMMEGNIIKVLKRYEE